MLDKAVVIKTCVPVIQEARLQQVLIVQQMVLTFVVDALPEKLWFQACVPNVLWAKQRLD